MTNSVFSDAFSKNLKYTPYSVFIDGELAFTYKFTTVYDKESLLKKYQEANPGKKIEVKRARE